ncbi:hypothetical protein [Polymorphospora sp. A560]
MPATTSRPCTAIRAAKRRTRHGARDEPSTRFIDRNTGVRGDRYAPLT